MGRLLDLADGEYRSSRQGRGDDHRHPALVAAIIALAVLLALTASYTGWTIGARVTSGQGILPSLGGPDGDDGQNGQNGQDGQNGSSGQAGGVGPSGPPGPAGSPGPEGSPGAPGSPGPPGVAVGLADGVATIGTCDSNVGTALSSRFDFPRRTFWLTTFTLTRVSSDCDGLRLDIVLYDSVGRVLGSTRNPVVINAAGLPEVFVTVLATQFDRPIASTDVAVATIEITP